AIVGGIVKYHNNIRYLEHEYYSDKKEYDDFIARNIGKGTQAYWSHYSLRPSILRVSTLKEIGDYKNETGHFEMDYAKKYSNAGYKSAFLDTICSYHIGKCTWERGDNSYTLNGVKQFNNTPIPKKVNISKIEDDIWMVVDNFDSFDNDIKYIRKSNIDVLKNIALADPKCVGFNSLGYFKSIILPSHEWKDISNKFDNFKMYIHKERFNVK
ncbi:MAG: hypothetical protein MUO21_11875, partial [Nitrososphaeraceae archaeon]|nr:hypothetical protein [Nitrososphaeraceae archaeon]